MQPKLHFFVTLRRKIIFSLAMALCLVLTFTVGASAHTRSVEYVTSVSARTKLVGHVVSPQSTGGGCGGFYNSSQGDISASACINFDGITGELQADGYVTFRPNFSLGYISACYVQTLIISNHGQYPGAFLQQNCVNAASNSATDAYFGVVRTTAWSYGDYANGVVNVKMTYSGGTVSVVNLAQSRRIYL